MVTVGFIFHFTAPPDDPSNIAVHSDNPTELTVSWSPASSGSQPTSFHVKIKEDNVLVHAINIDSDETSYTFTGLKSDTDYVVSVVAINSCGQHSNNSVSASQAEGKTGECM